MKRLIRKAYHDVGNRQSAIIYVNGEIHEGFEHWDIIQKYIESKVQLKGKTYDQREREVMDILNTEGEPGSLFEFYGMANRGNDDVFYIIEDSLENLTYEEFKSTLEKKYPGCECTLEGDLSEGSRNLNEEERKQYEQLLKDEESRWS